MEFERIEELVDYVESTNDGKRENDTSCGAGIMRQFDKQSDILKEDGLHSIHYMERTYGPVCEKTGDRSLKLEIKAAYFDDNGDAVEYNRTVDGDVVKQEYIFKNGSVVNREYTSES